MYDVIAVSIHTRRVRIIGENKTEDNADAIISMALDRNGVEEEFFTKVTTGTYRDGDLSKTEKHP